MAKPLADRKAKGAKPKRASPKTANAGARAKIKAEHAAQQQEDANEPVYDPVIASIILTRLADGETLNSICATEGMPASRTVRRWALDADHVFAPQYTRAREIGYHGMADECKDLVDDARNDWMERHGKDDAGWVANGEHIGRSRLRFEARKWLLSKALPKIYGDKLALTDADGGAFKVQFVA